jgi:hypothetical protein
MGVALVLACPQYRSVPFPRLLGSTLKLMEADPDFGPQFPSWVDAQASRVGSGLAVNVQIRTDPGRQEAAQGLT